MSAHTDLRALHRSLSDEQHEALTEHRGGCSCHLSPPCFAHSEPLTEAEAIELGFIEEPAEAAPIDYIGEVRRLCK